MCPGAHFVGAVYLSEVGESVSEYSDSRNVKSSVFYSHLLLALFLAGMFSCFHSISGVQLPPDPFSPLSHQSSCTQ